MKYSEIRALSQSDAQRLLQQWGNCWRLPRGGQMKHIFTHLSGAIDTTLCGKQMYAHGSGDWRNITTKRRCPRCTHALSLLRIQAGETEKEPT